MEMTPATTHIFKLSLLEQAIPGVRKIANVHPIPKELPVNLVDFMRPISVTEIIVSI